jgi:hypothetical protein
MRWGGLRFFSQPALAVRLVVAVVPVEPDDLALSLEREDVGRDAVEKPPVVAHDDGASPEFQKGFFERAQVVDVEVVGAWSFWPQ